jgi:hypothetical protein
VIVVADAWRVIRTIYHFDLITSLQTMIFIPYDNIYDNMFDIDEIKRDVRDLEVQQEGMSVKVSRKPMA